MDILNLLRGMIKLYINTQFMTVIEPFHPFFCAENVDTKINQPLLTPTQQYYTHLYTKASKTKGGTKRKECVNIQLMTFPIQQVLFKIIT